MTQEEFEKLLTEMRKDVRFVALSDAARLCREKARHCYTESKRCPDHYEYFQKLIAQGNRCDDCAEDIEALRDQ